MKINTSLPPGEYNLSYVGYDIETHTITYVVVDGPYKGNIVKMITKVLLFGGGQDNIGPNR